MVSPFNDGKEAYFNEILKSIFYETKTQMSIITVNYTGRKSLEQVTC